MSCTRSISGNPTFKAAAGPCVRYLGTQEALQYSIQTYVYFCNVFELDWAFMIVPE